MRLDEVVALAARVSEEIERVIVGKPEVVRRAVVGLLAGGHILIEDIPGVGKTMLARAISGAIGGEFRRIQFTPDLLPADITGTTVYNQKTGDFAFRPGPVFANVVLADEINRATPKVQSALLECMEEQQVTVNGATRELPDPFLVIATENPIEFRGTHPLPETQLDRFLIRIRVGYPAHSDEIEMLSRQARHHPIKDTKAVTSPAEVVEARRAVREVHIESSVRDYIVRIVTATRSHPEIAIGASPRGSIALMRAGQACAAIAGRDCVTPDDVKSNASACLLHRMVLGRMPGDAAEALLARILDTVPVPVLAA